jgi:hypothetical protein
VPERTGEAVGDGARKARSRPCSAEMGVAWRWKWVRPVKALRRRWCWVGWIYIREEERRREGMWWWCC